LERLPHFWRGLLCSGQNDYNREKQRGRRRVKRQKGERGGEIRSQHDCERVSTQPGLAL
jgi:hypothetical protein